MQTLKDITRFENVPILVRAALNVPIKDGKVVDAFRLRRAIATIEYLQSRKARVIIIGHIGEKGTETLLPVYEALKQQFSALTFCPVPTGKVVRQAAAALLPGEMLMLENLRRVRGEVANDQALAQELASHADLFVQDSFDVCHRKHASVVGVPALLPSFAGLLLEEEVRELSKALTPKSPSLAIIGGAKFATKEPVLKKLLNTYDHVFVGGALANDFMAELGLPMEYSLISTEGRESIRALATHPRLLLPKDEIIGTPGTKGRVGKLDGKAPFEAILDDGPNTITMLEGYALRAKSILWNGPLGNYENGFVAGTQGAARAIAKSSAHSIVGGGDTVAAIESLGLNDRFSFISTGGGAMLEFLATGTLPGIEALD